ncbi:MAG: spermidine dehydrogenase, partial [Proteobacteria bacterium]|nr:spermidine dehydrogenase [Pseudomonadota bacterium]
LPAGFFGVSIDAVSALNALMFGLPGINQLGVVGAGWLRKALVWMTDPYIYHFPDGNASVARLLVRSLIPEIHSAHAIEDLVQARFDYAQLDRPEHNVRIRLNSTAIKVTNHSGRVSVDYQRAGRTPRAEGKAAVLACYNMMIPYLCPDLPEAQKAALKSLVKIPLVYSNVALTNWRALKKLGVGFAVTPSAFHDYFVMDFPVSLGKYAFSAAPDEPVILLFLVA